MEITEIKFRRFPAQGRLRALVSVTFDGVFAVHDIKVIAGDDHLFLAMPARRAQEAPYPDIVPRVGPLLRQELERRVLAEYRRLTTPHAV